RELRSKPPGGWELEYSARAEVRIQEARRRCARDTAAESHGLILLNRALRIGHVEPIHLQPQFFVFTHFDWVVSAEIQLEGARTGRASGNRIDRRAARHAETFVLAVNRVWNQRVERDTGLCIEVTRDQQLPRRAVATVSLELMRSIVWQTSVRVGQQLRQ